VVFYDVWKEDQRHYAGEYKVRVIPTQVFLDEKGQELMRHEGFFPEKDIDAFLQSKGLKPKTAVKD
jgi:thioredoxin 1